MCQNLLTEKNLWFLGGHQLKKTPCMWLRNQILKTLYLDLDQSFFGCSKVLHFYDSLKVAWQRLGWIASIDSLVNVAHPIILPKFFANTVQCQTPRPGRKPHSAFLQDLSPGSVGRQVLFSFFLWSYHLAPYERSIDNDVGFCSLGCWLDIRWPCFSIHPLGGLCAL